MWTVPEKLKVELVLAEVKGEVRGENTLMWTQHLSVPLINNWHWNQGTTPVNAFHRDDLGHRRAVIRFHLTQLWCSFAPLFLTASIDSRIRDCCAYMSKIVGASAFPIVSEHHKRPLCDCRSLTEGIIWDRSPERRVRFITHKHFQYMKDNSFLFTCFPREFDWNNDRMTASMLPCEVKSECKIHLRKFLQ